MNKETVVAAIKGYLAEAETMEDLSNRYADIRIATDTAASTELTGWEDAFTQSGRDEAHQEACT